MIFMNQDQIKTILLTLNDKVPDFSVILTGKASRKVHGLYKPSSREILLHNKNFDTESQLIYTAIHEFAHHVHFSSCDRPSSQRSHTIYFWDIFHRLLRKAEDLGFYRNVFTEHSDFVALTKKIKTDFLKKNGQLMKDLGRLLLEASELCRKHKACFEDYMDRELGVTRSTAKTTMLVFSQDLDPEVGFDQMKALSTVHHPSSRYELEQKVLSGFSPDMIKKEIQNLRQPIESQSQGVQELQSLVRNRDRLKTKIQALQNKLQQLEILIEEKELN